MPFMTKDGSTIREYFHTDLQSLAEASLEPVHLDAAPLPRAERGDLPDRRGRRRARGRRRQTGGRPRRRDPHPAGQLAPAHGRIARARDCSVAAFHRTPTTTPSSRRLERMSDGPISFARGAPAPELVPSEELADCAHAVAQRDGARIFAYGPGGGYAPAPGVGRGAARRLSGARRAHRRRPPGIRVLRGGAARAPAGSRARRGAELRPTAQDPRARRGRDRRARDGRRGPRSRRARARAAEPQRTAVLPLHDPDVPEPERPHPVARAPAQARRDRSRARTPGPRGRPVRPRSVRGRPASRARRARGRRARHVHVLVLEDGRARGADGLLRPSRCGRGLVRGACGLDVHLAAVPPSGHRLGVRRPGAASSPTSTMCASSFGRGATRCSTRSRRTRPPARRWSQPEGGYFVWLEVDGADSSALAAAAEREGVTFIAGSGFFPASSNAGARAARLAYSYETPERIAEGIERIARLLG